MKKSIIMTAIAAVCIILTSCNPAETIINANVKVANAQCPIDLGSGLKTTSLEYTGLYVIYNVQGDDTMYSFSQANATEEIKEQLIASLQSQAMIDDGVRKFIKALREKGVGVIYHYFTSSTVMDVVIESYEL